MRNNPKSEIRDPKEVIDNCHFGLNFLLYITYLRFVMNLPYNKIATLLKDTYNARVSEGTIVDYLKRAGEIFGPEYERIKRENHFYHYDDTGQRVNGEEIMLYHTCNIRSKKVVVEILGEDYDGVTVDNADGLKQKCWAHLLRDAKNLAEKEKPPPESIKFYDGIKQIFQYAKEVEKQINPKNRASEYAAFVEILDSFATIDWKHHDVKRLAKRALKYKHELFTFILIPGIEPTNNREEKKRALRPCVVQRKIWGCDMTNEGAKNKDILRSILGYSKLQEKNFFNYGKEYILNFT